MKAVSTLLSVLSLLCPSSHGTADIDAGSKDAEVSSAFFETRDHQGALHSSVLNRRLHWAKAPGSSLPCLFYARNMFAPSFILTFNLFIFVLFCFVSSLHVCASRFVLFVYPLFHCCVSSSPRG